MARSKDAMLRLHGRLVKRRDALRQALSGDLDSLREYHATFDVGDTADAAIDTANDEINSQLAELEGRELEQIEHALDRIEAGIYGRCELCGGKIPEARINALPYTSTCIECQRRVREVRALGLQDRLPAALGEYPRGRVRVRSQPQRLRNRPDRVGPLTRPVCRTSDSTRHEGRR